MIFACFFDTFLVCHFCMQNMLMYSFTCKIHTCCFIFHVSVSWKQRKKHEKMTPNLTHIMTCNFNMIFKNVHRVETGARFLNVFVYQKRHQNVILFWSLRYLLFYVFFEVIFMIFTMISRNMHGAPTRATFLTMAHTCLKVVKRDFCFPWLNFGALV